MCLERHFLVIDKILVNDKILVSVCSTQKPVDFVPDKIDNDKFVVNGEIVVTVSYLSYKTSFLSNTASK